MTTKRNVERVLGKKLIAIEADSNGSASGDSEEIILHFEDGSELLIYRHEEEGLIIEGD